MTTAEALRSAARARADYYATRREPHSLAHTAALITYERAASTIAAARMEARRRPRTEATP